MALQQERYIKINHTYYCTLIKYILKAFPKKRKRKENLFISRILEKIMGTPLFCSY